MPRHSASCEAKARIGLRGPDRLLRSGMAICQVPRLLFRARARAILVTQLEVDDHPAHGEYGKVDGDALKAEGDVGKERVQHGYHPLDRIALRESPFK